MLSKVKFDNYDKFLATCIVFLENWADLFVPDKRAKLCDFFKHCAGDNQDIIYDKYSEMVESKMVDGVDLSEEAYCVIQKSYRPCNLGIEYYTVRNNVIEKISQNPWICSFKDRCCFDRFTCNEKDYDSCDSDPNIRYKRLVRWYIHLFDKHLEQIWRAFRKRKREQAW